MGDDAGRQKKAVAVVTVAVTVAVVTASAAVCLSIAVVTIFVSSGHRWLPHHLWMVTLDFFLLFCSLLLLPAHFITHPKIMTFQ